MPWIKTNREGILLTLHINPRAAKDELCGLHGNTLKLRLKAPPVDGKANAGLIKFLSKTLKVPPAHVRITHGESGRQKHVLVVGISEEDARALLTPLVTPSGPA